MLAMLEAYLGEAEAKEVVSRVSTNVVRYLSLPGFNRSAFASDMDEYDIMAKVRCDLGNAVEAAVAEGKCEHNWDGGVVAEEAGCITAGSIVYTCVDCGAQYDEVIPTHHSVGDCFKKISGTAATCTADGSEVYECTLCGNKKTVTTAAFHKDAAYYSYKQFSAKAHEVYCTVCSEKVDVKEHTFFTIDTATCTEGGQLMDQCRYCGYETLPTDDNGNPVETHTQAKGHNLTVERVEATCTSDGYEGTVCKACDYAETTVIKSEGHKFEDGACTVCGEADPDWSDTPDYIPGDVNGDGAVNAMDANIMKRILSGTVTPTDLQILSGDVNGDGELNGFDSNFLSRIVSGKN
jgi:hypothetical protein